MRSSTTLVLFQFLSLFTTLHCMQYSLGDCKAGCPSICLSVKRVSCDKTNERSADILIPYKRSMFIVFRHEEWVVGDVPFYRKFWAKLTPPLYLFNCKAVCVSVKCVNCDKTNKRSADIIIPHERSMHVVFWHEEWLVGNVLFYLKFCAKLTHPLQKWQLTINICS